MTRQGLTRDPEVALLIGHGTVARHEESREPAEVDLLESLVVFVDGACDTRPGRAKYQVALLHVGLTLVHPVEGLVVGGGSIKGGDGVRCRRFIPLLEETGSNPEEWTTSRTGLHGYGAGQGGDHMPTSLGLPEGVHNGAATVTHYLVVPGPGRGVYRLANGAQDLVHT